MKAIVGLGNPGRQYEGTRHNIGFAVVDEVARRWNAQLRPWRQVADVAVVAGRAAVLVEPQTFMNLSGEAVRRIADFHKLEPADVLVIVDEVQLPVGRVRVRRSGSAGGHNGLKSIIQHIGTEFPRLRIGVGRGDPQWDLADHVLSRFGREEHEMVDEAVQRAADAAELFVGEGVEAVMNRFNAEGSKSS
ncbi:MAG: aminoacyl-tRNA hydrolase [Vicinamibacterales bacterium]